MVMIVRYVCYVIVGLWVGSVVIFFLLIFWCLVDIICKSGVVFSDKYFVEVLYLFVFWIFVVIILFIVMGISYIKIFLVVCC